MYFFTFGKNVHSFSDAMREIKLDYVTINHGAVHFSVRSFAAHFFNLRKTPIAATNFTMERSAVWADLSVFCSSFLFFKFVHRQPTIKARYAISDTKIVSQLFCIAVKQISFYSDRSCSLNVFCTVINKQTFLCF